MEELENAARTLHLSIADFPVDNPAGFEPAFAKMSHWGAEAVLVLDDAFLDYHRELIANLAIKGRLPSIFGYRLFVDGGGLMSYGYDFADQFRRSAKLVDKILKGAKPGDLPVEQPAKFELVINLRTMKALGIMIPQADTRAGGRRHPLVAMANSAFRLALTSASTGIACWRSQRQRADTHLSRTRRFDSVADTTIPFVLSALSRAAGEARRQGEVKKQVVGCRSCAASKGVDARFDSVADATTLSANGTLVMPPRSISSPSTWPFTPNPRSP